MAFKLVLSFTILSVVSAGVVDLGYNSNYYHQPAAYQPATYVQPAVIKQAAYVKQVAHEAPANYEFNYEVHDAHTGDIKRQQEVAKDGAISGQYSLIDADGYRRVVSYTADDHHGFQANVQREPVDHKIVAQAPVVTKVYQPATISKVYQPAPVFENHGHQYHY
ncbi:cuticle protein 8-like [Chironomus tepperi]|uniref:cuticle protein 8-like n=1 Tax=Chironomus tepperi TaxID=113505 RepID=UPI00391F6B84